MRHMILAAASALTLVAGSASAADLRMPVKAPAAVVAQTFDWSGFYFGGFVGGAWADRNEAATELASTGGAFPAGTFYNAPFGAPYGYGLNGSFMGGITLGYNWQMPGSGLVLGLEGEGGFLRVRSRVIDPNSLAFGSDTLDTTRIGNAYGVIAGRLGFAWDRVLIYGKGGVAFVGKHTDVTDTCTVAPCGGGTVAAVRDTTQTTWAAGGGLEWALTNNWSVKAEYLYLATRETYNVCGAGGAGAAGSTFCSVHTDPGIHTAKLGLNYRFNWGAAPVVARY